MTGARELPNSFIFVANFRHYPNVDAMIYFCGQVLPLVRENAPSVRLYIVGVDPPPEVQRLEKLRGVTVVGHVGDVRAWIASSSVYVAPIVSGRGVRIKILEAWAMGRPVVSTRLGCLGLNAVHGKNVFLTDTPQEFASSIVLLLGHPELGSELGNNARMTVQPEYE
jgi:glycosyltransferase involved in cell wall biosynthesis